jgi:hypothetical protein
LFPQPKNKKPKRYAWVSLLISLNRNYFAIVSAAAVSAAVVSTAIAVVSTATAVESTAVSVVSDLLQEARAKTEATARKRIDFFILGFSLMFNKTQINNNDMNFERFRAFFCEKTYDLLLKTN